QCPGPWKAIGLEGHRRTTEVRYRRIEVRPASADSPLPFDLTPRPVAQPVRDQDRSVADWVLAHGGLVDVNMKARQWLPGESGKLPTEEFHIVRVRLPATGIVNADFERFVGLKELVHLEFSGPGINPGAITHLARLDMLETLSVSNSNIASSALAGLR